MGGRRALVAILLVVAGCDATFGLVDVHNPAGSDAAPAMCGGAVELQDTFDANAIDVLHWNPTSRQGATTSETGGEAVLDLGAGAVQAQTFAQLQSRNTYDVSGHQVSVEVTRISNTTSTLQAVLYAGSPDGQNELDIVAEQGFIDADVRELDTFKQLNTSIPYDPAYHRFWSIRERGGTVTFETSPDRITWVPMVTYMPPFAVTSLYVGVYTYTDTAWTDPGLATFDNFVLCKQP